MATICTQQDLPLIDTRRSRATRRKEQSISTPSRRAGYVRRVLQWLERRRDQRESRDAYRHLLKLDDSLLQDIGVVRADVERAARLPLAENAAQVLRESARRNRTGQA